MTDPSWQMNIWYVISSHYSCTSVPRYRGGEWSAKWPSRMLRCPLSKRLLHDQQQSPNMQDWNTVTLTHVLLKPFNISWTQKRLSGECDIIRKWNKKWTFIPFQTLLELCPAMNPWWSWVDSASSAGLDSRNPNIITTSLCCCSWIYLTRDEPLLWSSNREGRGYPCARRWRVTSCGSNQSYVCFTCKYVCYMSIWSVYKLINL